MCNNVSVFYTNHFEKIIFVVLSLFINIYQYFCLTQEGPAYTWLFNFHTFVRLFARSLVRSLARSSLRSNFGPYTFIKGQRDKGTKQELGNTGTQDTGTQEHRITGTQEYRNTGTQEHRNTGTQEHGNLGT